jgi:hypothetical protein
MWVSEEFFSKYFGDTVFMMVQLNHSVQSTCKIIVDVVYEL